MFRPFTLIRAEGTFANDDDVEMPLWTTTGVGVTRKTENSNHLWRRALGQAVVSGIVFVLVSVLLRVMIDDEAFGDALPISVITGAVFALTFGGLTVVTQRARQKRHPPPCESPGQIPGAA